MQTPGEILRSCIQLIRQDLQRFNSTLQSDSAVTLGTVRLDTVR